MYKGIAFRYVAMKTEVLYNQMVASRKGHYMTRKGSINTLAVKEDKESTDPLLNGEGE